VIGCGCLLSRAIGRRNWPGFSHQDRRAEEFRPASLYGGSISEVLPGVRWSYVPQGLRQLTE